MSNRILTVARKNWRFLSISVAGLVGLVLLLQLMWPEPAPVITDSGELTMADLDLRDGVLYLQNGNEIFTGTFVENYGMDSLKLAIEIRKGVADGLTRGWYDNGQLEVEETFVNGVSNGTRTRWYDNGIKKSEAMIVDGVLNGRFLKWHINGQKAAEVTMTESQPHGLALAWHPSGSLKSRVQLDHGVPVEEEFFPDTETVAKSVSQ
jgi:antitoxin component YwqK of YwqJK toxin-antitoxin module